MPVSALKFVQKIGEVASGIQAGYVMNTLIFVLVFLSLVLCSRPESVQHDRSRRSVLDFGNMIRCTTGRDPWDYVNYGCYCGMGGKGKILDAVDRCCKVHDNCYRRLRRRRLCSRFGLYISSYDFSCSKCSSKNRGCSRGLCRCDRQAARCFKRNTYNRNMKNVDRGKRC